MNNNKLIGKENEYFDSNLNQYKSLLYNSQSIIYIMMFLGLNMNWKYDLDISLENKYEKGNYFDIDKKNDKNYCENENKEKGKKINSIYFEEL